MFIIKEKANLDVSKYDFNFTYKAIMYMLIGNLIFGWKVLIKSQVHVMAFHFGISNSLMTWGCYWPRIWKWNKFIFEEIQLNFIFNHSPEAKNHLKISCLKMRHFSLISFFFIRDRMLWVGRRSILQGPR